MEEGEKNMILVLDLFTYACYNQQAAGSRQVMFF
jgi:hypothetical protein